jgi:hypothetical protein
LWLKQMCNPQTEKRYVCDHDAPTHYLAQQPLLRRSKLTPNGRGGAVLIDSPNVWFSGWIQMLSDVFEVPQDTPVPPSSGQQLVDDILHDTTEGRYRRSRCCCCCTWW